MPSPIALGTSDISLKTSSIEFTRQLLDSDVKKCNEMAPSLLIVKYLTTANQMNGVVISTEKPFIAGVKSRLIPVDSMDIVERLATKNKTKISFLNFLGNNLQPLILLLRLSCLFVLYLKPLVII